MNNISPKYYVYALVAYAIPIIGYIFNPGTVGSFAIVKAFILIFLFFKFRNQLGDSELLHDKRVKWFAVIILFGIINFLLRGKYDWMSLALMFSSVLGYFSVFYCVMILNIQSLMYSLRAFILVLLPTAILSYMYWDGFLGVDVPHILTPFALFFIITPFIKNKMIKYVIIVVYLFSVIFDTSVRACLLTGIVSVLILISYKFAPTHLFSKISKSLRYAFFVLPIVFLCLGIWGNFNIFSEMENADVSKFDTGSGRKSEMRSLNTDSRTGVYLDVLYSIEGVSDIMIGKGEVINLESTWIETRHSVEAGILNIFLRYGLIGCVVFFLILWHSTKEGLYNTNNTLTQIVAIYLAYKFLYMFIEDANINISTFIAMGICMSESIRSLTNEQIKEYLQ